MASRGMSLQGRVGGTGPVVGADGGRSRPATSWGSFSCKCEKCTMMAKIPKLLLLVSPQRDGVGGALRKERLQPPLSQNDRMPPV
jgi:hypothetical protein